MNWTLIRGETLSLALEISDPAELASIAAVTGKLRPLGGGGRPEPTDPPGIAFAVAPRAASGSDPGGWTLTLSPAQTAQLAVGRHWADARLTIGTSVDIIDLGLVLVVEGASS